jgi:hypothetical protein
LFGSLGEKLGGLLQNNAWKKTNPEKVRLLKKLGIPTTEANALEDEWSYLYSALVWYYKFYGNSRVPEDFVVPPSPLWPKQLHRLPLGKFVEEIRTQGKYILHDFDREKLLYFLQFDWVGKGVKEEFVDVPDKFKYVPLVLPQNRSDESNWLIDAAEWVDYYCALYGYWRLHNGSIPEPIPRDFVIQYKNTTRYIWPFRLLGFPLGEKYHLMKTEGKYVDGDYENILQLRLFGLKNLSWPTAHRRECSDKWFETN